MIVAAIVSVMVRPYRTTAISLSFQNAHLMTRSSEIDFPPVETADEDGLLMLGGRLTTAWLLAAYRRGIFPWPLDDLPTTPTAWWCPDPRAVIEFDAFHISQRLARTLRGDHFLVTLDRDFESVVRQCALPRDDGGGVWLTEPLQQAYIELHRQGFAHSVEVWQGDALAGGVYGVALGGYFSAESMFHRQRDASKVALVHLLRHLQARGFSLVDIQVLTEHTARMGAGEIPRAEFLDRLPDAMASDVCF